MPSIFFPFRKETCVLEDATRMSYLEIRGAEAKFEIFSQEGMVINEKAG